MKNLATKNKKDFTVLPSGEAFISQRKTAELCGVLRNSVVHFFKDKSDITQGVSSENLQSVVQYYCYKNNQTAISTLLLFAKAGAKAYIYDQAGYQFEAKRIAPPPPIRPLTPQDIADNAISLLVEMNDRNKVLEDEKDKLKKQISLIGNHLAGSTISEIGDDLMFNVVAKLLATNLQIKLGQNTLMLILRRKGWLMIGRNSYERNMPSEKHIDLMRVYLHYNEETGKMNATTVLKPKGLKKLSLKIVYWYAEFKSKTGKLPPPPPSFYEDFDED